MYIRQKSVSVAMCFHIFLLFLRKRSKKIVNYHRRSFPSYLSRYSRLFKIRANLLSSRFANVRLNRDFVAINCPPNFLPISSIAVDNRSIDIQLTRKNHRRRNSSVPGNLSTSDEALTRRQDKSIRASTSL